MSLSSWLRVTVSRWLLRAVGRLVKWLLPVAQSGPEDRLLDFTEIAFA
jgi:hypothetical protein